MHEVLSQQTAKLKLQRTGASLVTSTSTCPTRTNPRFTKVAVNGETPAPVLKNGCGRCLKSRILV